jgi:single-strand DNA-binding protein
MGRLTKAPEIRYVQSGNAVCSFSMAVNRRTKQGDEVFFVDCVAWNSGTRNLADLCNNYLEKGAPVLIEGRLAIREYTTKDGDKRKATEIILSDMQMIESKSDAERRRGGGAPSSASGDREYAPARSGGGGGDSWPSDNDDLGEIPFLVDPREEREHFFPRS